MPRQIVLYFKFQFSKEKARRHKTLMNNTLNYLYLAQTFSLRLHDLLRLQDVSKHQPKLPLVQWFHLPVVELVTQELRGDPEHQKYLQQKCYHLKKENIDHFKTQLFKEKFPYGEKTIPNQVFFFLRQNKNNNFGMFTRATSTKIFFKLLERRNFPMADSPPPAMIIPPQFSY